MSGDSTNFEAEETVRELSSKERSSEALSSNQLSWKQRFRLATTHPDHEKLRRRLSRRMLDTIKKHQLIEEGDRIMVAVSGGKDSYTLLQLLWEAKQRARQVASVAVKMTRSPREACTAVLLLSISFRC